ncbi:MAG: hypothetical protein IPG74_14600 [Flavobacteriales bacterium]|nr:hypothetical protein [Flavobacteriales bacterium]
MATATGILVTAAWMLGRDREWRGPLMVLCALLWTEVALRVALNHLFGVNYPEDRAAFQLLVLFLLAGPFAVDALASVQRRWQWSALALLPIPLTTLANLNLEVAMNNLEQGVPERFIKYAAAKQKALGRPLVVAGGGQLITGWAFGLFAGGEMVNDMEMELFGQSAQDLRVVPYFLMDRPHRDYAIVDSTKRQAMYLLERKTPLNLKMVLDSALADAIDPKDFHNFLELRGDRFKGVMLYVRVSGDLSVDTRSGQVMVIADERDSERRIHWDETDLMHERAVWNGEAFDVMRRLPANPGATERYCYLWNVTGAPMKATALRLRVYVLDT